MTYIPQGFANGIQTLEKNKIGLFCLKLLQPKLEVSIFDPKLKIRLPLKPSVITKKDKIGSFYEKILVIAQGFIGSVLTTMLKKNKSFEIIGTDSGYFKSCKMIQLETQSK